MNTKAKIQQKKIVSIIHFFTRSTDGVGMQVIENTKELRKLGWQVIECSSDVPAAEKDSFHIEELDFTRKEIADITRRIYTKKNKGEKEEDNIISALIGQVRIIHNKLQLLIEQYKPSVINVRNMLSLPIHPAATIAIAAIIQEYPEVFFLTQHHDFVDEGRSEKYTTPYPRIKEFINRSLLYDAPNVRHAVINSLAQEYLRRKHGIKAHILPDSFDFDTEPVLIPNLREKVGIQENDLIIGITPRIVTRKAIEVAIQFAAELQKRKQYLLGEKRGVHARTITEDTKFILLLLQSNQRDKAYFDLLSEYAKQHDVDLRYIGDKIVADTIYAGQADTFPFFSFYRELDIIIYPSYREGFGNQFLESIALGKDHIVIVHLYPVMISDIQPLLPEQGIIPLGENKDYRFIDGLYHLRKDIINQAVDQEIYFLLHPEKENPIAHKSYRILKAYFSSEVVGRKLALLLDETRKQLWARDTYSSAINYMKRKIIPLVPEYLFKSFE